MNDMKLRRAAAFVAVIGATVVGACADSTEPRFAVPAAMRAITPVVVAGTVGSSVVPAPAVRVTYENGEPVPHVQVAFRYIDPTPHEDRLGALSVMTDADGIARAAWTFGSTAGEYTLIAETAGLAKVVFTGTATEAPPPHVCKVERALDGQLAFVRGDQIYSINADGSGTLQLTNCGVNSNPAWSPDGQRLAFVSKRDGSTDIYVMTAAGTDVVRRTTAGLNDSPAWSPDGRKIAFSSLRDGQFGIYVMDVDGDWSQPVRIGYERGWNAHPTWSPDGTKIAFISDWRAYDFVYDLYVMNADGSNIKVLKEGPIISSEGHVYYFEPAWAPDGLTIAAVVCPYAWDNCYPNSAIAVMNADGSGIRTIATPGGFASPTWSPDGNTIAYGSTTCRTCESSIRYVAMDGSRAGLITQNGHSPAWRPRR